MKTTEKKLLVRGILLGYMFSAEIFAEHFEPAFSEMMQGRNPPLKSVVLGKIIEIFYEFNSKSMKESYNWASENFDKHFDEMDVDFIRYVIHKVQVISDPLRMN